MRPKIELETADSVPSIMFLSAMILDPALMTGEWLVTEIQVSVGKRVDFTQLNAQMKVTQ